jgi:tricorn protease-like protein
MLKGNKVVKPQREEMSHATSDLEYFMCDMCQVYVHRDIYCNHRRACKGPDSQELKKGECNTLNEEIGKVARATYSSTGSTIALSRVEQLSATKLRNKIANQYTEVKDLELKKRMANAQDLLSLLE